MRVLWLTISHLGQTSSMWNRSFPNILVPQWISLWLRLLTWQCSLEILSSKHVPIEGSISSLVRVEVYMLVNSTDICTATGGLSESRFSCRYLKIYCIHLQLFFPLNSCGTSLNLTSQVGDLNTLGGLLIIYWWQQQQIRTTSDILWYVHIKPV